MTIEELHADAMRLREEYHAALQRYVEARLALPPEQPLENWLTTPPGPRADYTELRGRIMEHINGEPVTISSLSEALGTHARHIGRACDVLVLQRRLERAGWGRVKKPDRITL
jgi:hypothetical protein